jgi:cell wall-associated NlpC family hydrolase
MNGPEEFVRAARALKGARWRHRGRKPWAVDCIGLVAVAGQAAGLLAEDVAGYGREPWEDRIRKGCRERWGEPVPIAEARPGDIAIFRWKAGDPSHMGILADHPDGGLSLIHADNLLGVVECGLRDTYERCLVEVFRPRFAP